MNTKKLIIYDFDGVVVDSREAIYMYYNMLMEHFGFPKPEWDEQLKTLALGASNRQFLSMFAEGQLLNEMSLYVPEFTKEQIYEAAPLCKGFKEALAMLKDSYNFAICTNRGSSLDDYMDYYGLNEYFSFTVTALDVWQPKPSPEGIYKICEHYDNKNPLFVGDTSTDLATARAAGVRFLAFGASVEGSPFITDHRNIIDYL